MLTFVKAAQAGAACSESGEGVIIDDQLSTSALAATFTGLADLSALTTTTTATGTTLVELDVNGGLEAEEVGVRGGTDGMDVLGSDLVVDGGDSHLVSVSFGSLILDLLMGSGLGRGTNQALRLGSLLRHVVIEGEANFFLFLNGLGLALNSGSSLSLLLLNGGVALSLLGVGLLIDGLLSAPSASAVSALAVATTATAGAVLSVHGVSILAGLTLESAAVSTTLGSVDNRGAILANSGGAGTSTTATTAATLATTASTLTASTATTALATFTVATTTLTTASTSSAATATTSGLGGVINLLELLSVLDGSGLLDDNFFASILLDSGLLLLLSLDLGCGLNLLGVGKGSESVLSFGHTRQGEITLLVWAVAQGGTAFIDLESCRKESVRLHTPFRRLLNTYLYEIFQFY